MWDTMTKANVTTCLFFSPSLPSQYFSCSQEMNCWQCQHTKMCCRKRQRWGRVALCQQVSISACSLFVCSSVSACSEAFGSFIPDFSPNENCFTWEVPTAPLEMLGPRKCSTMVSMLIQKEQLSVRPHNFDCPTSLGESMSLKVHPTSLNARLNPQTFHCHQFWIPTVTAICLQCKPEGIS